VFSNKNTYRSRVDSITGITAPLIPILTPHSFLPTFRTQHLFTEIDRSANYFPIYTVHAPHALIVTAVIWYADTLRHLLTPD